MVRRFLARFLYRYIRRTMSGGALFLDFILAVTVLVMSSLGHLWWLAVALTIWAAHILCALYRGELLQKLRKFYY